MNKKQFDEQVEQLLWVVASKEHKVMFIRFVEQAKLLAEVAEVIDRLGPSVTIGALGEDLLKRIKEATV